MADDKQQQGPEASDPKRPAKGDDGQALKAKPLTFSQHILIWSLILVVGLLFGMGTSVGVLQESRPDIAGVTQREILLRQDTDRRLMQALGGMRGPRSERDVANQVKIARIAESQGLMPSGAALEQLVEDFLDRPARGGRTVRDVLVEAQGGDKEVTRAEVKRLIAEEAAANAFFRRRVLAPAVPLAVAETIGAVQSFGREGGDQVPVLEATLDASRFLQPIPDGDPELVQAYDRLRQARFTRPEAVRLTVAYADLAALTAQAKAAVTDEQARAYYEAHRLDPDFVKPAAPSATAAAPAASATGAPPVPPAPESRPFDEMKPVIVDRLAAEQAAAKAKAAAQALDAEAEAADGVLDRAAFKAAAAKAGLAVAEDVPVEAPKAAADGPRVLTLPGIGTMRDESSLFAKDKEPGFISRVVGLQPAAGGTSAAVLRLEGRDAGGFRPREDPAVQAEVVRWLQGQRAYATFIKEARQAREQAQRVGLAAWAASAEGQAWKAATAPGSYRAAEMLIEPAAELNGPAGESRAVASLAMPERPVALVAAPTEGDLPRAKLVQATGYTPAPAMPEVAMRGYQADEYRNLLSGYRAEMFRPEIDRLLQGE